MSSIFNITRSTYFNSGHISDYFKKYFDTYAVYSINSHNTKKTDKSNLQIYRKGNLIDEKEYLTLPINAPVYLVPIYQFLNIVNIVRSFFYLRYKHNIKPDIFISSFSLWSLTGSFMELFGFCKNTVFWLWDYFPKVRGDPYYLLLNILEPFERLAINISDNTWYASKPNFEIRKKHNQIKNPLDKKHKVVHWGTGGNLSKQRKAPILNTGILHLIYFGSLDVEKGLDIVIDNLEMINNITEGKFKITLIGGQTIYRDNLEQKIRKEYKSKIKFLDFMSLEDLKPYAESADLGLAMYIPEVNGMPNYTYYADPAKPRDYLTYGLPMIISKVPEIYKDIENFNAGLILDPYSVEGLKKALKRYIDDPQKYFDGVFKLSKKDRYDVYYSKFFDEVLEKL